MRELLFLVADNECAATLRGLLELPKAHLKLGCGPFPFEPAQDLLIHPENDPGVFHHGEILLATKRHTHRRAVVVLDEAWNGSPLAPAIIAGISGRVAAIPWNPADFEVICIAPELEAWIWQDRPPVDTAFQFRGPNLRQWLAKVADVHRGKPIAPNIPGGLHPLWPIGAAKPPDPKRAVEVTQAVFRSGPTSGVFNEITSRVSLAGCVDPAFAALRAAFQRWFPPQPAPAAFTDELALPTFEMPSFSATDSSPESR